jgi:hypothetical protein
LLRSSYGSLPRRLDSFHQTLPPAVGTPTLPIGYICAPRPDLGQPSQSQDLWLRPLWTQRASGTRKRDGQPLCGLAATRQFLIPQKSLAGQTYPVKVYQARCFSSLATVPNMPPDSRLRRRRVGLWVFEDALGIFSIVRWSGGFWVVVGCWTREITERVEGPSSIHYQSLDRVPTGANNSVSSNPYSSMSRIGLLVVCRRRTCVAVWRIILI